MRTSFGPLLTVSDHHCPCGRPVDEDGACYRCDATEPETEATADPCRCGEESTDPATGYVDTCPIHPAPVPVPDALARLSASLCTCDKGPCPLCREIARRNGELSGGRS